jgi:hypothetical protein
VHVALSPSIRLPSRASIVHRPSSTVHHPRTSPSHALSRTCTRTPQTLERTRNIGPHDGHVSHKPGNCSEEVAEQDEDAVQFDEEADKSPLGENQRDAYRESKRAFPLLAAREEGERFCRADDERQADEEEDLERALGQGSGRVKRRGGEKRRGCRYIAHCQPVDGVLAAVSHMLCHFVDTRQGERTWRDQKTS